MLHVKIYIFTKCIALAVSLYLIVYATRTNHHGRQAGKHNVLIRTFSSWFNSRISIKCIHVSYVLRTYIQAVASVCFSHVYYNKPLLYYSKVSLITHFAKKIINEQFENYKCISFSLSISSKKDVELDYSTQFNSIGSYNQIPWGGFSLFLPQK